MVPQLQIDDLVKLGFVVVVPEYRLCPQVNAYDGPIQDAKDSFIWTKETLPRLLEQETGVTVDPARVAAMGHSAGGNLALHLVCFYPRATLGLSIRPTYTFTGGSTLLRQSHLSDVPLHLLR